MGFKSFQQNLEFFSGFWKLSQASRRFQGFGSFQWLLQVSNGFQKLSIGIQEAKKIYLQAQLSHWFEIDSVIWKIPIICALISGLVSIP